MQAGLAEHVAGRQPVRRLLLRHRADEPDAGRPSSAGLNGPSPTKASDPSPLRSEGPRQGEHVLPLGERAEAQERGAVRLPTHPSARLGRVAGCERSTSTPQSTTSVLPRASGTAASSRRRSQCRDGDQSVGAARDETRRGADGARGAGVLDVLPVGGGDERRASAERSGQPGRDEEVGVDDVRPERARRLHGVAREREVAPPAARPPSHDRPRELVPPARERGLEPGDEDAQIGILRAWIHLRDEGGSSSQPRASLPSPPPHSPAPRPPAAGPPHPPVTCTIPRHISSVVPSPHVT